MSRLFELLYGLIFKKQVGTGRVSRPPFLPMKVQPCFLWLL